MDQDDDEPAKKSSSARSRKGRGAPRKAQRPAEPEPVRSAYEQLREENVAKNNKVSTCESSKCVPTGEVIRRQCVVTSPHTCT